MAFRNPIRTFPASAIIGQIPGSQITGPVDSATSVTGPVNGSQIVAGSLGASAYGVGSIGYQALAVGTGNLIPDPSFEGQYAANLAAVPSWSITTPGNNSPKAITVDATAGVATTRSRTLMKIQINPGDRLFFAVDYKTSATWAGQFVKFYAIWRDGNGTALGFAVIQDVPVPGATWKRISGLTAGAQNGVASADIIIESYQATAGTVSFDNAELRTALVAGAVSAGIITAGMLSATAIDGKTITGSVLQTAATGNRVIVHTGTGGAGQTTGLVEFFTEVATDSAGSVTALGPADGVFPAIQITAPKAAANPNQAAALTLSYDPDSSQPRIDTTVQDVYLPATHVASLTGFATVTTSGATAATGWTLTTFEARRFGPSTVVRLALTRTGATITANSAGNITDTLACTLPGLVSPTSGAIQGSYDKAGIADGNLTIGTDGTVTLKTLSPTATIVAGEVVSLTASFMQ